MAKKNIRNTSLTTASKTVRKHAKRLSKSARQAANKIRPSKKAPAGNKKRKTKSKAKNTTKRADLRGSDKRRHKRDQRARKKAEYLATLPKDPIKRILYRLSPKRFFSYWFSKRGAVMALKLAGIGFAVGSVLVISLFAYFRRDLPDPTSFKFDQATRFYDRTGEHLLWSVYGDENRTLLEYGQISDYAKWATISIEDKDFYDHGGFDVSGIGRAVWSELFGDGSGGGGSTITQQFIKNSLIGSERTYTRKLKELILAVELERLYTKDEILTFYLNEIPYGVSEYGIESASQGFFDKPASELTIDEAAMLAALPNAPTLYSPYGENLDLLDQRQDFIVSLMAQQGYITEDEAKAAQQVDTVAKVTPLANRSKYKNIKAPHFVLEVQKQLTEKYGEGTVTKGGLEVITTLDMDLQKIAEEAVANNVYRLDGIGADNTAFSASDPKTGQILAMVGSRDFNYPEFGSFNVATSLRQPGSSFKPYSYAELFKSDQWGPGSNIYDVRTSFGNYTPRNWDGGFKGKMTIRSGLAQSRNIPAVKSLYIAGVENVINQAKSMGITSLGTADQYGLSLVLGAAEVKLAEHTHAYGAFANGGVQHDQAYVLKVTNANGKIIEEWTDTEGEQVLDPQIAYLITHILSDSVARSRLFGAGSPYANVAGLTMALKTGTTDLERDGWMMAYTPDLVVGSWVGNNDNEPMYAQSYTMTGSVVTEFMRRANEGKENKEFERPDGIKSVRIDSRTGRIADDKSTTTHTDLFPSWYKGADKEDQEDVTIDKISGKLATECTPERAKEESKVSGILPEIPESDPLYAAWSKNAPYGGGSDSKNEDDVHKCSDTLPNVSVSATEILSSIWRLEAVVSKGTHPLSTLNFKVDGQIVSSMEISANGTYEYIHTFTSTGAKDITAEVIDEVLYDNSNSDQINVLSLYGGTISITSPSDGSSVPDGNLTIEWDELAAADAYQLCYNKDNGTFTCISDSGLNEKETISVVSGSSYEAYVIAKIGSVEIDRTATISFLVL